MPTIEYETIIGLEVHVQLRTRSKMFCSCPAEYQKAAPNTLVCPVCLGMPGVLPVINRRAVEYTITTGLALNCSISPLTKFDRKNYPYPDLMKGYQISQYDTPIATEGYLDIEANGSRKRVGIIRVHLEEDVAKLQHVEESSGERYSLVDVNRSGVPLMEIVGHPDLRSPEEARQYLTDLRSILQYIGVTTGNMQDGSFRCDANISIRPRGAAEFMPRAEVKNMNSFRAVYNALEYEVERQREVVEKGGRVAQETRGWVEERGVTVSQRSKEYAHDYRYFPEPDLPPLAINGAWIEEIRASIPELPAQRRQRFIAHYGLPLYDAALLVAAKDTADFYEAALSLGKNKGSFLERAKATSNWLLGDVARLHNAKGIELASSNLTPANLAELVDLVEARTLSTTLAKAVLEESFETGKAPREVVAERGYVQISDTAAVEAAVAQALGASPQAVADYLKGREAAAKFIVGQVMRITGGQANPALVNDLVKKRLEALKNSQ